MRISHDLGTSPPTATSSSILVKICSVGSTYLVRTGLPVKAQKSHFNPANVGVVDAATNVVGDYGPRGDVECEPSERACPTPPRWDGQRDGGLRRDQCAPQHIFFLQYHVSRLSSNRSQCRIVNQIVKRVALRRPAARFDNTVEKTRAALNAVASRHSCAA